MLSRTLYAKSKTTLQYSLTFLFSIPNRHDISLQILPLIHKSRAYNPDPGATHTREICHGFLGQSG
jgi:hypothetical protein